MVRHEIRWFDVKSLQQSHLKVENDSKTVHVRIPPLHLKVLLLILIHNGWSYCDIFYLINSNCVAKLMLCLMKWNFLEIWLLVLESRHELLFCQLIYLEDQDYVILQKPQRAWWMIQLLLSQMKPQNQVLWRTKTTWMTLLMPNLVIFND